MPDSGDTDDRPEKPELFISYASGDVARAAALHARLAAAGFVVWFDRIRLTPGCDWHAAIEAGCEAARVVLPVVTPRWAGSEWTRYETYAHDAVIPVLAEGKAEDVMPPPLRRWNAVALDPLAADEAAWQALLDAIRGKLAEPVPERAARIVDLPYPANPFFTGRDDDLVRIHEELHAAPVAALTQGRVRALAAMGGIGKTTLANEYARRYWRLYSQILWVDARFGLESGFALLFGKLFPGRPDAGMQQPDKAAAVLTELAGRAERLLVLDNVEDAESVRPWLVRDPTSGCRTLITSRFADWPAAAGVRAIQLYVLEPGPARQFLLARTGRAAEGLEVAACDELAGELGYLPLALEQAAAYIAAPGAGVDFAGYLRLYREATAELLARGALGSTEYPDPVIATWQATVAKLSPESRAVLRLCAWYADTPIPRALVMQGAEDVLALAVAFGPVAPLSGPAAAELRMRDALTGLARYSMILDADDDSFRAHGLVQTVERARALADGMQDAARDRALSRLAAMFPYAFDEPARWPLCRQYLPHVRALASRFAEDRTSAALARLLDFAGTFLLSSGDAAGALPDYRRALASRERVMGPDHLDTLVSLNNLAECLGELGDAAGALPLHRRALEGKERVLGRAHPNTLTSVNNLAACLLALGDAAGALPLYRRALESREHVLGKEHPDTLTSVNNLAECMRALGDAAGALPLYRRALDSLERVLGKEHPNTLSSVNNLAGCMRTLGNAAAALPLYRRALDSRERVLGKEHPDTLTSVNNLAGCMQALGDAKEALPLLRRALDSRERVLGKEHPDTLTGVNNLAECMRTLGDAAGALPFYRRALETKERVLGKEHPDTLTGVNNLGECMRALGDSAGALPLYRRALEVRERVFGPDHPDTLSSVNNLAKCTYGRGDAAGASPLFRQTLERRERVLGPDHPDTLGSVNDLAVCMLALGDTAAASLLFRRALDSSERMLGPDHPETLTSVNNLAGCMQALGDAAGALPLYRWALASRERVLGAEHPDTLTSMHNLARCLQALGDTAGALTLFRRVLELQERVLGPEHWLTLTSVHNLAECLRGLGDAAGALPLYRRALAGFERVLGPEHPTTLAGMSNLAVCMWKLGDAAGALPLHRQAVDRFERILGLDHPDTLTSVHNLALCLQTLGDMAGALLLFRRVMDSYERVLGPEHPHTLTSVNALSGCLEKLGQFGEARILRGRRALEAQIRKLGPEHRDVLTSQNNLAQTLRWTGHPDLAEAYARQCADASARVMGDAHPLALHRRSNLALTLLMLRSTAEARSLLAANWAAPCPHSTPVTQATAFLAAIAALLDGTDAMDPLGRLKTLLLGPNLQQAPDVGYPWDAGYLLDYLRDALPPDSFDFLQAALAAINDPARTPDLDRFPLWRDTPALPLDIPWPTAPVADHSAVCPLRADNHGGVQ